MYGERRGADRVLLGKRERKRPLVRLGLSGNDNIKMNLNKFDGAGGRVGLGRFDQVQDRDSGGLL
jgi:hypothetical protein